MTREQKRQKRISFLVKVMICTILVCVVIFFMGEAAAKEQPIDGRAYLESIGASPEQQDHIMGVLYD